MAQRRNTSRGRSVNTATSVSAGPPLCKKTVRRRSKSTQTVGTKDEEVNDDGTQMEGVSQHKIRKKNTSISEQNGKANPKNDVKYDEALARFVKATVETGCEKLVLEFNDLKIQKTEVIKTAFDKNPDKNRYRDVVCIDDSRVILNWPADNPNDYIHANFVQIKGNKKYICTQGPTPKTNEDFWRMVVQEKIMGIVMLTEVMELGKKKCEQYWPKAVNETMTHGPVTIKNLKVVETEKQLTLSHLEVTGKGQTTTVEHFLWNGWPDRGVPENYLATLRLVRKLSHLQPCLVHCSAGIGRTGTIVGLDLCQRYLCLGEDVTMMSIVQELRKCRHGSVQTAVQYLFMHAVIVRLAENRHAVAKDVANKFLDEYTSFAKKLK